MFDKELGRNEMHKALKEEIVQMQAMEKLTVISVVVGAMKELIAVFEKIVGEIVINKGLEHALKTTLFGKVTILRLVFRC